MPAGDMPAAEVDISTDLVRRLVARQFPDLDGLQVEPLASGWDNALFRLGDDLVVRMPRRRLGVPLIDHEQRWLPVIAPRLPLPIPAPVRCGVADDVFPWPWSICPYFPGTSVLALVAGGGSLTDPTAEAARLGAFVAALQKPAPSDAPDNPFRGVPLADRNDRLHGDLARLHGSIDADAVLGLWAESVAVPPWSRAPVWLHGDLHPGNVVTDGERITAVVDFGDITAGDPASDLAAGWYFFDPGARAAFRDAAGVDDDTWRRARGWALCLGATIMANSADNPPYAQLGRRTVSAALEGH